MIARGGSFFSRVRLIFPLFPESESHTIRVGRSALRFSKLQARRPCSGVVVKFQVQPLSSRSFAAMATAAANKSTSTAYDRLITYERELTHLEGISGLLGWDEQVTMPHGAAEARGKQHAALALVLHDKQTSKQLGELIEAAEKESVQLTSRQKANIHLSRKSYDRNTKIPRELHAEMALLQSKAFNDWVQARANNDFAQYSKTLTQVLQLAVRIDTLINPNRSAYENGMDKFDPDLTVERIDSIFSYLKGELPQLIERIKDAIPNQPPTPKALLGGEEWDVKKQAEICRVFAEKLGFDFEKGRIDVSAHPFTGGAHITDVRITTRYSCDNWYEGISGTIHEAGHGMYEQGRDGSEDYLDTPVTTALGMAVHESQSLFWERMIALSLPFWKFATPLMHQYFPHTADVTAEEFYRFANTVKPDFIRVDADEVTYPLHIILRYEMERDLYSGALSVEDVPEQWNAKMKTYLGLDVPSDAKGCLQDVHWSGGAFGYFPSYTLGAMIAVQWYEALKKEVPDVEKHIENGNFAVIREWLNKKVHAIGSEYENFDKLLTASTGKPLDPKIFVDYLKTKFSKIYNL